jgi:hypothetical protein
MLKRRRLSIIIFTIGALFGLILLGASVYADFESSLFDVSLDAEARIRPVSCPILLASHETGVVSATVHNLSDEEVNRLVRANISRGHLIMMREDEQRITMEARESQTFTWEVTAKDAAYGHLILAKITVLENARKPLQKGSCGVLVLNLPFGIPGWVLVSLIAVIGVFGTVYGAFLWWQNGRSYTGWRMEATRAISLLSSVIIFGLLFSALGLWELAAIGFYIAVLATGVIVPHFVINRNVNS